MGGVSNGWDMLPTWAQWSLLGLGIVAAVLGVVKLALEILKMVGNRSEPTPQPQALPPHATVPEAESVPKPEKLRRYLIRRARMRASVSYDEAARVVGMPVGQQFFRDVLDVVSIQEIADERPNLTALVHNPGRVPGPGFYRHHGFMSPDTPQARSFWEAEKERVFGHWSDLRLLCEFRWELIFDPIEFNRTAKRSGSKPMRFGSNGAILEGRNENENRWRAAQGLLEFIKEEGVVLSRFELQPDAMSFVQTNEHLDIAPARQLLVRREKL